MKVSQLETNNGQLGWLPKNPRQWTQTDIDRTKASIQEDTDFLEDRPLLVCPGLSGKYVVFGGNLRLTAARSLKLKEVPVVVYCLDEGGPEQDEIRETIKRRAMKDNGSFGAWDYDALANEWDDLPLQDWGVPSWNTEDDAEDLAKTPIDIEGLFDPTKERPGGPAPAATLAVEIPIGLEEEVDDIMQAVKAAVAGFEGVTVTKK